MQAKAKSTMRMQAEYRQKRKRWAVAAVKERAADKARGAAKRKADAYPSTYGSTKVFAESVGNSDGAKTNSKAKKRRTALHIANTANLSRIQDAAHTSVHVFANVYATPMRIKFRRATRSTTTMQCGQKTPSSFVIM